MALHRTEPPPRAQRRLEPFTIIFTDIQSSTSLWAEVPEEMGAALEVHHRLIRQLIKRHRGYEVKTIGDAFMIAFKEADDAVRLAYELQHCFFKCREFSPAIDAAYVAFDRERLLEAEAAAEDAAAGGFGTFGNTAIATAGASDTPALARLSAHLTPEAYAQQWSGLRVRVGIHTAFGDIKRDEVTDAYDYYGTVTNTAARVEAVAHGGQVCFTETTLRALSFASTLQISSTDSSDPSAASSDADGGFGHPSDATGSSRAPRPRRSRHRVSARVRERAAVPTAAAG